jgi:hypothetical protein
VVSYNVRIPQGWNRYTYALNNPLRVTDPLGLFSVGEMPRDWEPGDIWSLDFWLNGVDSLDELADQLDALIRAFLFDYNSDNLLVEAILAMSPGKRLEFLENLIGALRRMPDAAKGVGRWGRLDTLTDHFNRHGAEFGARTADEYARMASDFLDESRARGLPTKIGPDGTIRVYDPGTNTFGAYNPDGSTKTFYHPDPSVHGYPTNADYWNAQPDIGVGHP